MSFNLNDYETNSGVTAVVLIDDEVQADTSSANVLAAFGPDGSVRGVASPAGNIPVPPSPYFGMNHYQITVYGDNAENGSTFTFKYYSAAHDEVFDMDETITFAPPAAVGDVMNPLILNGTLSTDTEDCASGIYDCSEICDGNAVVDECGVCDDDPSNDCEQDCNGDWGGNALVDCAGVCGGSAVFDV